MENLPDNYGDLHVYLAHHSATDLYTIDHGWETESAKRTAPWLIWSPSEAAVSSKEPPEAVQFGRELEQSDRFGSWSAYRKRTGFAESFVPARYFGSDKEREEKLESTLKDLRASFELEGSSVPLSVIQDAAGVRDEGRNHLDEHAQRMKEEVMEPLRRVFIACAVEARRATTGGEPFSELNHEDTEKWGRTIRDLSLLYSNGLGGGIPFEILHEHENWYGRTFEHVPDPVARGMKAALSVYVERAEERLLDPSRDGILERARPIYFKWQAARRMIWAALYGWSLDKIRNKFPPNAPSERGREYLSAVLELEGEPFNGLSDWCKAVVPRCPKPSGEIPNWRAFLNWLDRNGSHKSHGSFEQTRERAEEWAHEVHGGKE
jgi:hypothetical protein